MSGPAIDPGRVIGDLRELDRRTGGADGARRVCWGPEWAGARRFLEELLAELRLTPEVDEAGNLWAYLEGELEPALAVGSHVDSVPQGGWLDGALGVMSAVGVLRSWAESGRPPPRTLALVDWADEEGARFGRSLFGSSAAAGTLSPDELKGAHDRDGRAADEVLAESGVALERAPLAASRLQRIGALLELHIEQGPVLESEGLPVAAVSGTVGIERWRFRFQGRASHAGTTPMDQRRDAGLAAAGLQLAVGAVGELRSGVATVGSISIEPGAPTVVPGAAEVVVDLRNADAADLAGMLAEVKSAAGQIAGERGCEVTEQLVWRIDPLGFDPGLVEMAGKSCARVAGSDRVLVSGALHDAAAVAAQIPVAMIFVRSIGGVSHSPEEDSSEQDLELAIRAYADLAGRALAGGWPEPAEAAR
ncbi:MAG: Zn-dependent hydrolase [Solirubrobacterales bacterium]